MNNKEKMELAMKLVKEVVDNTQTKEFKEVSQNNMKISNVISVFGEDMILHLEPLNNWIQDSDE